MVELFVMGEEEEKRYEIKVNVIVIHSIVKVSHLRHSYKAVFIDE